MLEDKIKYNSTDDPNTGEGSQNNNNENNNGENNNNNNQMDSNNTNNTEEANDSLPPTNNSDYITEITFAIGKNIEECRNKLESKQYTIINDDIRRGGKKKYVLLGYKKNNNEQPITNIIGLYSEVKLINGTLECNSCKYTQIIDSDNKEGDIHRGSGGNFLYLYYTRDKKAGLPLRALKPQYFKDPIEDNNKFIQNAQWSLTNGNLNIIWSRGGGTYNFIELCR